MACRKWRMMERLTSERCASDPKHTASAFSARCCQSSVHSMKSQATGCAISNRGRPLPRKTIAIELHFYRSCGTQAVGLDVIDVEPQFLHAAQRFQSN